MAHNDDFMYTRQETPREGFASELQARLVPQENYSGRQKRFNWQSILRAAASISILSVVLLAFSPDARAFVMQALRIDGWIAISIEDAQDYLPYMEPQSIPEGYERRVFWRDPEGNEATGDIVMREVTLPQPFLSGTVIWTDEITQCHIVLAINENLNSEESVARSFRTYEDFAERYDWMETFDIGAIRAMWQYNTKTGDDTMTIEWISEENIRHQLETPVGCMSQEEFIALAQTSQ